MNDRIFLKLIEKIFRKIFFQAHHDRLHPNANNSSLWLSLQVAGREISFYFDNMSSNVLNIHR
jgi:hypothetical protein